MITSQWLNGFGFGLIVMGCGQILIGVFAFRKGKRSAAAKGGSAPATVACSALLDCCPDWSKQLALLNTPEVHAALDKDGRFRKEGKHFNFCPWCGKKNQAIPAEQPNTKLTDGTPTNQQP